MSRVARAGCRRTAGLNHYPLALLNDSTPSGNTIFPALQACFISLEALNVTSVESVEQMIRNCGAVAGVAVLEHSLVLHTFILPCLRAQEREKTVDVGTQASFRLRGQDALMSKWTVRPASPEAMTENASSGLGGLWCHTDGRPKRYCLSSRFVFSRAVTVMP